MKRDEALSTLRRIDAEVYRFERISALLQWDQETYMPAKAIDGRAEQIAAVQSLIHRRSTDALIGEALGAFSVTDETPSGDLDPTENDGAFLRAWHRRYSREQKIPSDLVERLALETSKSQAVWARAKEEDRFADFEPNLEIVLGLVREVAECVGYDAHIYDALLDEYEPWLKTSDLESVFTPLAARLVPIVQAVSEARPIDDEFLHRSYPEAEQEAFGREVLADIGFPSDSGRLDVSSHPFTTSLGGRDVRLTTRYRTDLMQSSIFGTIHEAGHGLYELGFADELAGTILAEGTSLGIHESQSRTWENLIGRSRPFWRRYFPRLAERFPDQLDGVDAESFYRAINVVRPSLIRVEADEVTYNLHIVLRFELEKQLVTGELTVPEAPGAWREAMKRLLGIVPDTDREGVLQDIHWSMGGFGYFPTYALGNLYGAQFDSALRRDLSDVDGRIERGDFASILAWQREHIHRHGARRTAAELCTEVTGSTLDPDYFVEYIRGKTHELYGVS